MDLVAALQFIQARIVAHSTPTDDPNHGQTDSAAWVADLVARVMADWPEGWQDLRAGDPGAFDENMRLAREVGLLLCAWFSRVSYAKTMDPRRPVKLRRDAHDRRQRWLRDLLTAVVNSEHDAEVFPGQEWESPWLPTARDGSFI